MLTKSRILIAVVLLIVGVAAFFAWKIGPRNIIGMMLYDQRREGALQVGDRAPDVMLAKAGGAGDSQLSEWIGGRPLVLIFGSFT